jgi:hypothetical protein
MVTGEYALMRLKPSSEFDQARQARNTLPGWFALTWAPKPSALSPARFEV